MNISMEKTALLKAIGQAQSVVERRQTIPILANVLIETCAEGLIRFRATNLNIDVTYKAAAHHIETKGAVTVSASMLHEIIRKMPEGALITFEHDQQENRLHITGGRSKFSLATMPAADFPELATPEYTAHLTLPRATLRHLIDKAKFAMSNEETRYYLNGVYFHLLKEKTNTFLACVATDGHRLAKIQALAPEDCPDFPSVILPRRTVPELRKLLEDDESDIEIAISEEKICFSTEHTTLISRVVDGRFPEYARVIPKDNHRKLVLDAKEFAKAVDRVATILSERSSAVKLTLEEDSLTLSIHTQDNGSASEEITVAYRDEPMEIGFNARYLLEIAGQVDTENAVIWLNTSTDPALIQDEGKDSSVYVIMPMRT